MENNHNFVYRVFRKKELEEFRINKSFHGNELDIDSGFIHLSTVEQIKETINKYFKIKTSDLEDSLKWERSWNEEMFPHYYGTLKSRLIIKISNKANYEL